MGDDRGDVGNCVAYAVLDVQSGDAWYEPPRYGCLAVAAGVAMRLEGTVVPGRVVDLEAELPVRPAEVEVDDMTVWEVDRALGHGHRQTLSFDLLQDPPLQSGLQC